MTDAELLAAIAEGRIDALRTLHERHAPWLAARLSHRSSDPTLVEEVVWADPNAQRWDTGAPWWWVALGVFVLAAIAWSWDARVGKTVFYLGGRSSILAPWRSASRTTKPTNSPASSQKPPGSP